MVVWFWFFLKSKRDRQGKHGAYATRHRVKRALKGAKSLSLKETATVVLKKDTMHTHEGIKLW